MKSSQSKSIVSHAFLGNPALKAAVIARLPKALEMGGLTPTPIHEWEAESVVGNITGLTAQTPDARGYESALGWPYALGATHEHLIRSTQIVVSVEGTDEGQDEEPHGDEPTDKNFEQEGSSAENEEQSPPQMMVDIDPELNPHVTAWLNAIEPGSDLSLALLVFQRRLAGALMEGLPLLGKPSVETRALLEDWRKLLMVEPKGETSEKPWEQLRHQANQLAMKSERGQRFVAELIEAAGWPYEEAALDWLAGWQAFMQSVTDLDLDTKLDAKTAALMLASNKAWAALEVRAAAEPNLDIYKESESDPDLNAYNQPEIESEVNAARQLHGRPLVLALLAHFNASMAVGAAQTEVEAVGSPATASNGAMGKEHGAVAEVVGDNEFQATVLSAAGLVLVDFWAPWCGPCVQFMPSFMKLAEQYAGRVKFVKVNLDDNEALCNGLNIRSLPTVIVYEGGNPLERINNLNRGRICAVLDKRLAQGAAATAPVGQP